MKFLLFTFSLFLIIGNPLSAQTDAEDLKKYWDYRDRFLGNDGSGGFIEIGPDQGKSIPASGRNLECDCKRDWHLVHSKAPTHEGSGVMKWGDATVHLGYYLAMLSLEYQNLKLAKANTEEVRRELFYALKAYERLDKLAEVTLGMEPDLNGFFLRDDIPIDFYKDSKQPSGRRFSINATSGYDCVGSDYSKGTRAVDGGSYISQDQVTSLLFGFAFVKKFADDAVYEKDSSENFGVLASKYTHLIVSYMKEHKWKIKSPDGQKISNRWGGDARAFNSLFAKAAEKITVGSYEYNYNKKTFLGKMLKGSYGWAFGLHNRRNYSMIFRLMMISDQWSSERMAKRAIKSDKIFYALADAVLNDRKLDDSILKADFEKIIKSAPLDGPCCNTKDCDAPDGWRSGHLWFHTNHKNGNPHGLSFEYPGIDFMLIYNLYHYYYKEDLPSYKEIAKSPKKKLKPLAEPQEKAIEKLKKN